MPTDLRGWHRGERAIQSKLNYGDVMATAYTWVESGLPDQHRLFHTTRLPFVPLTTLDREGRPWSSLVAAASGAPGFIQSPSDHELAMQLTAWPGDPLIDNLTSFGSKSKTLVAGLGIEFSTRRRNKFAGWATRVDINNSDVNLRLHVNQAIGNCPKYINVRDLIPHPQTLPAVVYHKLNVDDNERLPDELVSFIHSCDTTFIGTTYQAAAEEQDKFPSHVGMNQRGGRAGFVRVRPSDGRTVILPDYSGNRLMTSLGNIEATPAASLSFTSFETGSVLYLTGRAQTLVGEEALKLMPRQKVLTALFVTGYIFVRDALPVRQRPRTAVERSPYSPPIRYLAEERLDQVSLDDVSATLKSIEILSTSLAAFTFEASKPIDIKPGQAAILDFTDVLGARNYAHMAMPGDEASVNDDRIRTWTVSSAHPSASTRAFTLTMRQKPGGTVTGALFAIARQLAEKRPEVLGNTTPLALTTRLIGIAGDFVLQKAQKRLLWIAGGIGVTPFLSMLASIAASPNPEEFDIALVLSTREPDVILSLIETALQRQPSSMPGLPVKLTVDLFTTSATSVSKDIGNLRTHTGRMSRASLLQCDIDIDDRCVFLCGPIDFEETMLGALLDAHYDVGRVVREGFGY